MAALVGGGRGSPWFLVLEATATREDEREATSKLSSLIEVKFEDVSLY